MKNVLLATTMLVTSAGFAAADVSLSGSARMGIVSTTGGEATFSSRARVSFSLSGQTDGGLSFGASLRADNAKDANNGDAGTVFVSGAFGKLTMGDIDQADKAIVGNISGVGYTGIGDLNELYYNASEEDVTPGAEYTYSAGDLTVAVSTDNEDARAAAASYKFGDYTVAAGVGSSAGYSPQITLGGTAVFGPATVKAIYQRSGYSGNDKYTSMGASVDYKTGAVTLTGFYMSDKWDNEPAYGLGASYDLGGGATFAAGLSKEDGEDSSYDAGLTFSF